MDDSAAPVSPEQYAVGDVIASKYRLECLIGEGGQAWVWQARNLALDAQVAIKVLRAHKGDAPQTRRLLQEARAAARLGHPAIVRVFDLGEASSGNPFLVMELLQGESLADRLVQNGRLSGVEAVRVLLPIADALRVAHAQGIVHRDLKPDNVFLTRSDDTLQPKLLDFGIVKLQQAATLSEQATGAGVVVGSPSYLSPEQARGREDVDHRVDIWSFCVTLYECLTGQLPFDGKNYNALLRSIVEEEPKSLLEQGVNEPELWQIVSRGLRKSRDERWQSALALGQSLATWAKARGVIDDVCRTPLELRWLRPEANLPVEPVPAPAAPAEVASPALRWRLLVAALAILVVAGALALFRSRAGAPSAEGPPPQELAPAARFAAPRSTTSPSAGKPAEMPTSSPAEAVPVSSVASLKAGSARAHPGARVPASAAAATPSGPSELTPRKSSAVPGQGGALDLIIPY
jgi:serine/threonine-protein kinase